MKNKNLIIKLVIIIFIIGTYITISKFLPIHNKEELINYIIHIKSNGSTDLFFICITILTSVFCVPISWLKALGGIFFSIEKAFIYSLFAATISCGISFMIGRVLGKDIVIYIYNKYFKNKLSLKTKKYIKSSNELEFIHIFLLRNIYFIPFSLTNYLLGITNVSFRKYMLASFLGMIPGTFLYTFFFSKLYLIRSNPYEILLPVILTLSYYILIYILKKRFIEHDGLLLIK